MNDTLYSPHWYRIADLHPELRPQVRVQRQRLRGETWFVLSDPGEDRHFRINAGAWHFVGLCNGRHSVQELWERLNEQLLDAAPTQGEIISLLARLAEAGLLQTEASPDIEGMFAGQEKRTRKNALTQLNPLFLRVRLLDPSPILRHFDGLAHWLFSRKGLLLWLLLVLAAGLGSLLHWRELTFEIGEVMQSPRSLFLLWLLYPSVKLVHELTHGMALRRWGGETHRMGVSLVLLTPIPWVDASAASRFPHRYQRFLVSAAGIMAELGLAAVAFFIWRASQPGGLHDAALLVMLISSISTLLFNGNPLLRYDGYFMLCDALGIPNLAARSSAYWGRLAQRYLLRLPVESQPTAAGERLWLALYAPSAFAYRLLLGLIILAWLLTLSRALFLIVAVLLMWGLLLQPLTKMLRSLWRGPGTPAQLQRARWIGLAGVSAALVLTAALPLPYASVAPGVVWLPEQARVRAETEGFIVASHAADGSQVVAGQPLLTLSDPNLITQRDQLFNQWQALRTQQINRLSDATGDARSLAQELSNVEAQMRRNSERISQLQVRATSAGKLVLPHAADLPGRFANRGDELGYVLPVGNVRIRAVVAQKDAELVRNSARSATVWLAETGRASPARLLPRDLAGASDQLPSIALGEAGGGPIPVQAEDTRGLTARTPLFQLELEVPAQQIQRVGGRALVRIDLGHQALIVQVWRQLQQVFLDPTHSV